MCRLKPRTPRGTVVVHVHSVFPGSRAHVCEMVVLSSTAQADLCTSRCVNELAQEQQKTLPSDVPIASMIDFGRSEQLLSVFWFTPTYEQVFECR